jgi:hypothetical protein
MASGNSAADFQRPNNANNAELASTKDPEML